MTRTDKVAPDQAAFSTPLFAEFDLGLLDPAGHVIPLDAGSMVETRREPTWPDSTTDPRSLALFLQRNVEGEPMREDKKQVIRRLEEEMRRRDPDSEMHVPGLDLELRGLFAGSLCPIYNDLTVITDGTACLVTLLERQIRKVVIPGSAASRITDADGEPNLVIGITVNVRRAVLCDGLSGYLRAVMDAGRLRDRIEHRWEAGGGVVQCSDRDVIPAINRAFGFSGHYYSVLTVMAGARK